MLQPGAFARSCLPIWPRHAAIAKLLPCSRLSDMLYDERGRQAGIWLHCNVGSAHRGME